MRLIILLILSILCFTSCKEKTAIPKPYAYYRIDLPKQEYQKLDDTYPFNFEYHKSAVIEKDQAFDTQKYWFNISYPSINAKIYLSYKKIHNNFQAYNEDSHKLAYKHTIKAEAINEQEFRNPKEKVYGLIYNIKGNTASSIQFFATDSTKNFLRASLYFNCKPNKDSLYPLIEYMHKDITHLIESLRWKDKN
jgi:gliding motility-associated lipoprotein GldD